MPLNYATRAKNVVRRAPRKIVDLIFPPVCLLCDALVPPKSDFCRTCEIALTSSESQMWLSCQQCSHPIGSTSEICPRCRDKEIYFDSLTSLWVYHGLVSEAIVAAKFTSQSGLADALGRRLGEKVKIRLIDHPPDVVTYVPSHFTRQFSRGGIGVRTIAQRIATILDVPLESTLSARRRITKQAWLSDAERVHNVKDAFRIRRTFDLKHLIGLDGSLDLSKSHVLIVDDVYTTGATSNEAARILCEGGTQKVSVATVARTVRTDKP